MEPSYRYEQPTPEYIIESHFVSATPHSTSILFIMERTVIPIAPRTRSSPLTCQHSGAHWRLGQARPHRFDFTGATASVVGCQGGESAMMADNGGWRDDYSTPNKVSSHWHLSSTSFVNEQKKSYFKFSPDVGSQANKKIILPAHATFRSASSDAERARNARF